MVCLGTTPVQGRRRRGVFSQGVRIPELVLSLIQEGPTLVMVWVEVRIRRPTWAGRWSDTALGVPIGGNVLKEIVARVHAGEVVGVKHLRYYSGGRRV